mmetsp:Transcript_13961/g.39695  ORF Transcript_13961/g.39695 Transcript_13961/m.39695 type:complete len:213 (+) Transcript_13961:1887-2525(+)
MPGRGVCALPPRGDAPAAAVGAAGGRRHGDRRGGGDRQRGRRGRGVHRAGGQEDHHPHQHPGGEGHGVQHAVLLRAGAAGGLLPLHRTSCQHPHAPPQVLLPRGGAHRRGQRHPGAAQGLPEGRGAGLRPGHGLGAEDAGVHAQAPAGRHEDRAGDRRAGGAGRGPVGGHLLLREPRAGGVHRSGVPEAGGDRQGLGRAPQGAPGAAARGRL